MTIIQRYAAAPTKSEKIRGGLGHPVIDADGHLLEVEPVLLDYIKAVGGSKLQHRYETFMASRPYDKWHGMSWDERRANRPMRPAFWFTPAANTVDRATAMLPGLLRSRLDEIGVDVSVLYPTQGLAVWRIGDSELRLGVIRALNDMNADLFSSYGDRLIPAAVIPMQAPQEALDELAHAVGTLGMKAIMIEGTIRRPFPTTQQGVIERPGDNKAFWIDSLGIDSAHDYDPVWRRCVDLKVSPTIHTGTMGWGARCSISNYNYNHIGHFAAGNEAVCKALFMGGVTRRFPSLRFGFLEGGVGWACSLYNDLIEHWEKRHIGVIEQNLDPAMIDRALLVDLFDRYGDARHREKIDQIRLGDGTYFDQHPERPEDIDDWAACEIQQKQDLRDLFVPNFYFGCEADDRMAVWAFNDKVNPMNARLKAMFSSDIGHWDVPDATNVLAESHRLVEMGLMSTDDYRDFVFGNAVTLYAGLNSDFFKGTTVEAEAARELTA
mgnify:CR=1 FL=1